MIPAIKVEQVTKQYHELRALDGVDLEIAQGEFFGLLGPNGAGKTTLISIIAGLARATSGTARVMGHDVVSDYRAARRSLGVVPQELVMDPFFTVRETLRHYAAYFPAPRPVEPTGDLLAGVVSKGDFPRSFRVPGTDVSLHIGGYARFDMSYDKGALPDLVVAVRVPAVSVVQALEAYRCAMTSRSTRRRSLARSRKRSRR